MILSKVYEDAENKLERNEITLGEFERFVDIEVIELKCGEWIDKGWKGDWEFETGGRGNCWHEYECSECGFHKKGSKSNFCPNCGARMKGADDE